MAPHITIDDITPRVAYTVGATAQSLFVVPFPFFANADLLVYVNDSIRTLTTHYTVTGAGVSAGGTITLVTAVTNSTVVIVRDIAIKRTTDFPNSGPLDVDALNTDLDKIIAIIQQVDDSIARVPKLGTSDVDGAGRYDGKGNKYGNAASGVMTSDLVTVAQLTAATGYVPASAPAPLPVPLQDRFSYTWSDNVTASDPTDGKIKGNSATMSAITSLYISEVDGNVNNIAANILAWVSSATGVLPRLKIYKASTPTVYVLFKLTLTRTDNGVWDTLGVTYITHAGTLVNGDALVVQFFSGDSVSATPALASTPTVKLVNTGATHQFTLIPHDGAGYCPVWDSALGIWKPIFIGSAGILADATNMYIDGVPAQVAAEDTVYQSFLAYNASTGALYIDNSAVQGSIVSTTTGLYVLGGNQTETMVGMFYIDSVTHSLQGGAHSELVVTRFGRTRVDLSTGVTGSVAGTTYAPNSGGEYLLFGIWADDGCDLTATLSLDSVGNINTNMFAGFGINSTTVATDDMYVRDAYGNHASPLAIQTRFALNPSTFYRVKILLKSSSGGGSCRSGFVTNSIMKAFTIF